MTPAGKPPLRAGQWEPDTNLVAYGLLGGLRAVDLSGPDRAWVVAGLTAAGLTAEETARRLHCSLRLVRQIRVEPMTVVAAYALTVLGELEALGDELGRVRRDHARELGRVRTELGHVRWLLSLHERRVSGG
jgi:hypothetical protein